MCISHSPFSERASFIPSSVAWAGEVPLSHSLSSSVARSGHPGHASFQGCNCQVSLVLTTILYCLYLFIFNPLLPFCVPSPHLRLGFHLSRQASGSCSKHALRSCVCLLSMLFPWLLTVFMAISWPVPCRFFFWGSTSEAHWNMCFLPLLQLKGLLSFSPI